MITSILSFALIGFATYFIAPIYGIKWFSISYSVGFIVLIILQSILLKKYMEGFNGKNFLKSIAKTILSTGIMAAIILLIQPLETIINIRVAVIMEILLGSGIFFLSAIYLKSPEISGVGDIVKKFLPKKSQ
ncbi:hypothetical protein HZC20_00590 [Candidatus Peregrinibacteria bacterium]|nr:hypothetical protein [Candidatus Peregrinibacteria bacterium]